MVSIQGLWLWLVVLIWGVAGGGDFEALGGGDLGVMVVVGNGDLEGCFDNDLGVMVVAISEGLGGGDVIDLSGRFGALQGGNLREGGGDF